jgi:hypothetical protein
MMSERPATGRDRRTTRRVALAIAGAVALSLVGVGTADAATHGHWWGHPGKQAGGYHPKPGRTTAPSPVPTASRPGPDTSAPASPGGAPGGATTTATAKPPTTPPAGTGGRVTAPPANAGFDYQIGGAYQLPAGVGVVSRDRSDPPVSGKYSICYINGYQAQPEEASWWQSNHRDLLLTKGGSYVIDGGWNEILLDITTAAKRSALVAVMEPWIAGCAGAGYQAVEFDNLDSWSRSQGLITQAHALAYAQLLVAATHARGLAVGQKNGLDLGAAGRTTAGFDFAIAEECADYTMDGGAPECQGYVNVYGDNVIVIEYDDAHFQQACTRYGARLSIVERDRDVTKPGSPTYVFRTC